MKSKKATIGATMTWVLATIIILVVMILFVYGTKVFVSSELVQDFLGNLGKSPEKSMFSSVDSEQMLLALLQTKLDGKFMKDYILDGEYSVLKNKLNPVLEELSFISFDISFREDDKKVSPHIGDGNFFSNYDNGGPAVSVYTSPIKKIDFSIMYKNE